MSSSHSDALNKVAAVVVTVAVASVSSYFSAIIVVGVEINFVMEAVEAMASSFATVFLLLFLFLLSFCIHLLGPSPTWTSERLPVGVILHPVWTWLILYRLRYHRCH